MGRNQQFGVSKNSETSSLFIGIFKHFALLISLIKVDLVLNLFFMATTIFFTYQTATVTAYVLLDITFGLLIVISAIYAVLSIVRRNEQGWFYFSLVRVTIEMIKASKSILIMNAINANYVYCPHM